LTHGSDSSDSGVVLIGGKILQFLLIGTYSGTAVDFENHKPLMFGLV
jgi:hypothetical protein